ncbi:MAG: hypothetical protein ACXADX_15885, partial [Candidatus Hodarchaeales archaeon]
MPLLLLIGIWPIIHFVLFDSLYILADSKATLESKEASLLSREIQISDLTLRDAHQSLLATRLRLRDMV